MMCPDPEVSVTGGRVIGMADGSMAWPVQIVEIAVSLDWSEVWDAN
jgi:hypothetical protein